MSRRGHSPRRTCLGCGAVDQQRRLLRIVRDGSGGLALDPARRAGGRGGYLHPRPECWAGFARRKGRVGALRAVVERSARAALCARLERDATAGEG